jgi:hypothetical protein
MGQNPFAGGPPRATQIDVRKANRLLTFAPFCPGGTTKAPTFRWRFRRLAQASCRDHLSAANSQNKMRRQGRSCDRGPLSGRDKRLPDASIEAGRTGMHRRPSTVAPALAGAPAGVDGLLAALNSNPPPMDLLRTRKRPLVRPIPCVPSAGDGAPRAAPPPRRSRHPGRLAAATVPNPGPGRASRPSILADPSALRRTRPASLAIPGGPGAASP